MRSGSSQYNKPLATNQDETNSCQYNKPLTNNQDGINSCTLLFFPLFSLLFPSCLLFVGWTLEVLNAVSHGLGLLLAIVGSVFLGIAASEKPYHCKVAVALYCIALNVLYIASTLFHSFYALGPTVVWVFGVLDHCAIYLLIAGSYCPFLSVFFPGALSEQKLLVSLWVMAFSGMITTAFYRGPQKKWIELSLYLGMLGFA
ncbi:unnamed protein product [Polarella glacialis]|uniref:Uncharacterized protein n=1 Tax=Polarella glacialis TaxID=89957 RepID=A0A813IS12_POLGL|nr:unnamed protein product [Polarella glacialis]